VPSASRRVDRVWTPSIALLLVNTNIGRSKKKTASYVSPSYTMRCSAVQGPTVKEGLSHLLPTNAEEIDMRASLPPATITLGCSDAHCNLGNIYHQGGDLKKAKFHCEAAAMAGHEAARCNLGVMEFNSGNMERAMKHWTIAASAGNYGAMHNLRALFEDVVVVSRELIDSTLAAYNSSCAEFRSEARDETLISNL